MDRQRAGKWVLSILLWVWTGAVYFFMEVTWKMLNGRPEAISWTMFLLAIVLAVPLERLGAELPWDIPLLAQAGICAIGITMTEFAAGMILNVWLGLAVWDYSSLPGNIMGQICPQFCILWYALSAVGIVILDWMRYAVEGGDRPRYK